MNIFNANQIKHCDQQSILEQGIKSIDLMERAATACLDWLKERYEKNQPFLVICGMGNNGGDGLALTRLLIESGYYATALILKHGSQFSNDTSTNLRRLHEIAPEHISILEEHGQVSGISENIIIIDAIFGTGINRPIMGWLKDFISIINELSNEKIAIDMPSGLPTDTIHNNANTILKANHTLTFQLLKRSLLHEEGASVAGEVSVLDIELSKKFITNTPSLYHTIDKALVQSIYHPKKVFGHKGTFGKAVILGGHYGMIGAIGLSTMAALKSGVGLVKTIAPECGNIPLQTLCPEAIFQKSGEHFIEKIEVDEYDALGIGPGLGDSSFTKRAFVNFLKTTTKSLVLDADALNIIAKNSKELINQIPHDSILTPHPGEFKRLFGDYPNSMEGLEKARNQAMVLNVTIVLKGHHTAILTPSGNCYYNTTGNPGLAKGGSGDVLTGLITGLKAQGYTSEQAAILGVWLHGKAGDIAAKELSEEALTAIDLCNHMGAAFKDLKEQD